MLLNYSDLETTEQSVRTSLINALSGYKSLQLVGTSNALGQMNLAPFSNVVHIGSDPVLMGFIHRPTTVERHTYENILETKVFTFNAVTKENYMLAHQCSARYTRNENEFEAVGIVPKFMDGFKAPFVNDSPIQIGLHLEEIHSISNGTHLIVGSVQLLQISDELIDSDGNMDLSRMEIMGVSGLDTYYTTTFHNRLSYAKPNVPLSTK